MTTSGVRFGTSGARGEVVAMTDALCFAYVSAFLRVLQAAEEIREGDAVALAGDRRESTPRILQAVQFAIQHAGYEPLNFGLIPTPALANAAMRQGIASIMVTGSHIPETRNGIKFYRPSGEILKSHEKAIRSQGVPLADAFDASGMFVERPSLRPDLQAPARDYVNRYLSAFGDDALEGLAVGVYGHSAVGRDLLATVLRRLGATVHKLGWADEFVAVDTEAIRPEDVRLAKQWAGETQLDALVSTDGDSDRPLLADHRGLWLRGDIVGLLCARALNIQSVVTPVNSNSAVERCGSFTQVVRTRIGSPYVIEAMDALPTDTRVGGYEANGGFLLGTDAEAPQGTLPRLPTRDAFIVIVALLAACKEQGMSLEDLASQLPARFTASSRLEDFSPSKSATHLGQLAEDPSALAKALALEGRIDIDTTDGTRLCFGQDEVVHLRASGNAPELRCYAEAATQSRARELTQQALDWARTWT